MKSILSKYFKGDVVIWGLILLLSVYSILAVYSSTGTLAFKTQDGDTFFFLFRHTGLLLTGVAIIFFTHLIPFQYFSRLSQLLLFISIPLLAWTLFQGTSLNEASRWLTLPVKGLSFQTSDLAKIALIMFIARFLAQNQDNVHDFNKGFRNIMIWIIVVCGLILPANFSTAAILFATSMFILFIGRISFKYLLSVFLIGVTGVTIFIVIMLNLPEDKQGRIGTWKNRIESFSQDNDEDNFQVTQAKIAIATGGFIGKGPGNSTQRNFLPHPYSDFIFAIIIEEYGLIGGFFLLFIYLTIFYRAGMIARKIDSAFGVFVTIGLAFSLVFQALINMAVAVNLLPVTGQTLPLVSMGGTSLLFTGAALGIILSVSRNVKIPLSDEKA
ncbi:MAG: cell division protein FtsW [Bacteroidetes bacterium HGW-Bacteroidetes-21]|jgi:cell division protein FtsW|nr:MAG: cell division protein FtsW [Bacteroidetes bacterium HGW-Bacteroidetes-21]